MATKKQSEPEKPSGSKLVVVRVQDGVSNQLVETDLGGTGSVDLDVTDGVVTVTVNV